MKNWHYPLIAAASTFAASGCRNFARDTTSDPRSAETAKLELPTKFNSNAEFLSFLKSIGIKATHNILADSSLHHKGVLISLIEPDKEKVQAVVTNLEGGHQTLFDLLAVGNYPGTTYDMALLKLAEGSELTGVGGMVMTLGGGDFSISILDEAEQPINGATIGSETLHAIRASKMDEIHFARTTRGILSKRTPRRFDSLQNADFFVIGGDASEIPVQFELDSPEGSSGHDSRIYSGNCLAQKTSNSLAAEYACTLTDELNESHVADILIDHRSRLATVAVDGKTLLFESFGTDDVAALNYGFAD